MNFRPVDRPRAVPPSPLTVDVPCLNCGREPSHPQVRYRFAYAAYWVGADRPRSVQRCYIAALCAPCAEAERRVGTTRVRTGFLGRVQQWSALARNRGQIVRIAEYPDGDPAEEHEGDACFRAGALHSYRALSAAPGDA